MYKRFLQQQIQHPSEISPVTLVLGGRQSGKTTLVGLLQNEHDLQYLSLDDLQLLRSARQQPDQFFMHHSPPLILDEIQRSPELFLPMKLMIDKNRKNGMFLLTGSANPLMLPNLGDSLAGRMVIHHLWPLSQGEILGKQEGFLEQVFAKNFSSPSFSSLSLKTLFKKMLIGGFPIMQGLPSDQSRATWCNSYLQTILDKDVRDLAQIEKLSELLNLLEILATRPGSLVNYSNLASTCKIPRTTLMRYFQYMLTLFTIHLLPPWFANHGKRLTKSSKIYFNDTGILCHLLRLSSADYDTSLPFWGGLVENFVVTELQKQISWNKPKYKLYFYRDHNGNEIDLIIEGPRKELVAIEIKSNETMKSDFFKTIRHFAADHKDRFERGIVLYRGDKVLSFRENLLALPIQALWEL